MSCSSSDGAAALAQALSPRLLTALAVSLALHALLVASLESPFGARWGEISWFRAGTPIRAVLRGVMDDGPAPGDRAKVPAMHTMEASREPPAADSAASGSTEARSLLPQPHYYRTRELDVPPGILVRVEPEYPAAAAARSLSGRVVIRLYIDESGSVERIGIVRAEPTGVFEASAERAFRVARFTPGIKDGRPVRVQLTLEVSFDGPPPPGAPEAPR